MDALALSLNMTLLIIEGVILPSLLMSRLAIVSTGWKIASSAMPALPLPKIRAAFDSFLKFLAEAAGPATTSVTDGAILRVSASKRLIENYEGLYARIQ